MAEIAPLTPLRYNLSKLPHGLGSVVAQEILLTPVSDFSILYI